MALKSAQETSTQHIWDRKTKISNEIVTYTIFFYDRLFPIQFSKHSTYFELGKPVVRATVLRVEWNETIRIYLRGVSNQASKSHTPPGVFPSDATQFFEPQLGNFGWIPRFRSQKPYPRRRREAKSAMGATKPIPPINWHIMVAREDDVVAEEDQTCDQTRQYSTGQEHVRE